MFRFTIEGNIDMYAEDLANLVQETIRQQMGDVLTFRVEDDVIPDFDTWQNMQGLADDVHGEAYERRVQEYLEHYGITAEEDYENHYSDEEIEY